MICVSNTCLGTVVEKKGTGVAVNEPSEVSECHSWYCVPQTVSVEEWMNQVQRHLSLTDCWLLALLIQASTHVLNFIRLRLYMNNP